MVGAVGFAVRHGGWQGSCASQQEHLGVHQNESREQLSSSVPREVWSGGKFGGAGARERTVCGALQAAGGGVVGGFERWLAGGGGWRDALRNGRAVPLRRIEAVSGEGVGYFLDEWRATPPAP